MLLALVVFVLVAGAIVGGYYAAIVRCRACSPQRQLEQRLREVSGRRASDTTGSDDSVVKRADEGPLPVVDRLVVEQRAPARGWRS